MATTKPAVRTGKKVKETVVATTKTAVKVVDKQTDKYIPQTKEKISVPRKIWTLAESCYKSSLPRCQRGKSATKQTKFLIGAIKTTFEDRAPSTPQDSK